MAIACEKLAKNNMPYSLSAREWSGVTPRPAEILLASLLINYMFS